MSNDELEGRIEALQTICGLIANFAFRDSVALREEVRGSLASLKDRSFTQTSRTFRRAYVDTFEHVLGDLSGG